jgi:arabinoxylan arabinofuranohydrolase
VRFAARTLQDSRSRSEWRVGCGAERGRTHKSQRTSGNLREKLPSKSLVTAAWFVLAMVAAVPAGRADNPIVQTIYTADPAPLVYNGVLYAYLDHDEDGTAGFFDMRDWRLFTTTDMVNWTDRGVTASLKTFAWGRVDAWAGQVIYRNNKFYYYVPIRVQGEPFGIGVGVSDTPEGPFVDAVGKPLVTGQGYIDPTVLVDDDGQAYMYFGNPTPHYVKLNADMISISGGVVDVSETKATFNSNYLEGPWLFKRNGVYILMFSSDGVPGWEDIRYSTSTSPTGPWSYKGIVQNVQTNPKSWTNHSGVVDYKGNSYFFYHTGDLPGGGHTHRSVCVEQFKYNADGSLPTIPMTKEGSPQIGHLNPFETTQAETIAFSSGLKTEVCNDTGGGMHVTSINSGDYIKVKGVNFGTGATSISLRVAAAAAGGGMELHLDSLTGTSIGTCAIESTGGAQTWATQSCSVTGATGIHDLFFKFTGSGSANLFLFNWWKFSGPGAADNPSDDAGVADGSPADGQVEIRDAGTGGKDGGGVEGMSGSSGGSTRGSGGMGGSSNGGTSNSGGTSSGGMGGSSSGGTSNSGGTGNSGGKSSSVGGSAAGGTSSSSSAASAAGGSTAGSRSEATGGTSGDGRGGSAGSSSRSGTSGSGGQTAGGDRGSGSSGCSCRVGGGHRLGSPTIVAALLVAVLVRRRKTSTRKDRSRKRS